MLTEIEKAWLDCAIDAEGSISFQKYGPKDWKDKHQIPRRAPRIAIYNTDIRFTDYAASLMGTRNCYRTIHRNPRWKPIHIISIQGTSCVPILEEIFPYLIIKK